jgi:hypothetical protein
VRTTTARLRLPIGIASALVAALLVSSTPAHAFFDFLFGPPAARSGDDGGPRTRITVTPRKKHDSGNGKMVCVRLCDGYHFPLSVKTGDKKEAEAACQIGCPGASVKVFTRRGEDMDDAVANDKSIYKKLANAKAFQKSASASCGCFNNTTATRGPVFNDPTMRQGDFIIVDGKAMTLKPGAQEPYDQSDYVEAERSRHVHGSVRNLLRAKLTVAPVVARDETTSRAKRKPVAGAAPLNIAAAAHAASDVRVVMPSPFETPRIAATPAAAAD